ncbi:MAG TPA: hypothetical protein VEX15_05720 [Nocardioidaceae bacterium]|nr:hypothetical protein [Nocardioidaceae bacterium]
MSRRVRVLVAAWPWLLALVICGPALAPGYVLSYDMVWVPNLALDRDAWGLGTALPRAVPSDAVVAVVDNVVPGHLLQKAILLASLGLAGYGAARVCRGQGAAAAIAAASLYEWNAFVAERLVLGHWPLLVGYAALPWIVVAGRRLRRGDRSAWSALAIGLAASATSAVGGLLGIAVALATQAGGPAATRRRRIGAVLATGLAVNAPWVVAGLAMPGGTVSDADAVERFGVEPEGWLGRLGALLSLGGVWNAEVVPDSRDTPIALLGLVTVAAMVVWGWRRWLAADRHEAVAFAGLAIIGLAIGLAGWLASDAVGWTGARLPGGGLLRDGTRFVPLLALGQAIAFGWAVQALADRPRRAVATFAVVLAAVWPLALLPDLAWGAGDRLRAVSYPDAWHDAGRAVDRLEADGDLLVLPFTAYRAPSWNHDQPVLDPAGRFYDRDTVVNDDLVVSGELIDGEDPRADAVEAALTGDAGADAVAARLAELGIGVVVVESDAGPAGVSLAGLTSVWQSDRLAVYAVPGPIADPPEPAAGRVVAVAAAWIAAIGVIGTAIVGAARRRWRPPHAPRG